MYSTNSWVNMKIKILLFAWVISTQFIFSQSLIDLYKKDLPKMVFDNEDNKTTVERNLQFYSSFSPDLAGYYIEYFKRKFVEKISDKDSNYYYQLQNLKDSLWIVRNKWIDDQLKELSLKDLNHLLENIVSGKIEDFSYENEFQTKKPKIIFSNNQLLKYYYYKYLSNNPKAEFNKTADYDKLIDNESRNIITVLDSLHSLIEVNDLTEVSQFAIRYKFLFLDSYLKDQRLKTRYSLVDFLVKLFKQDIKQEEGFFLDFNAGGSLKNIEDPNAYLLDEFLGDSHTEAKFHFPQKTDLFPSISVGAGYKFKLKKNKSFLSYLSIEGDYSVYQTFKKNADTLYEFSVPYFYLDPGSIVAHDLIADYKISSRKNEKATSLSFTVTAPIYYLKTWLYLAGGINYTFIDLSYDYDISKHDRLGPNGRVSDFHNYDITRKYEFTNHRVEGVISVNLNILRNILIDARYQTVQDFLFDIKYQF